MNRERTYKTRAVVLRARNLGEADRIYTLFTEARGKLDGVAKGVRRTKSHIAGRLEFMSEADLTMHRGRNLDVITGAELVERRFTGLARPGAFAAANVVAELLEGFCEPDLAIPEAYALLRGAVRGIAVAERPAALVPRFGLRLLDVLGLGPPREACVRCEQPFDEQGAWADVDAGGLSCAACRPHRADALALSSADLASFRALGAPRRGPARASIDATAAAARAVDAFVNYHLGKRPRSVPLVGELAHVPAAT